MLTYISTYLDHDLAQLCSTPQELAEKIISVINHFKASWIDFDVEGAAICDSAKVDLRNQALKIVQAKISKDIRFSYTLPCTPEGLDAKSLHVLDSAEKHGVRVDFVNIMAMYFGVAKDSMVNDVMASAKKSWNQVRKVLKHVQGLGVTPMVYFLNHEKTPVLIMNHFISYSRLVLMSRRKNSPWKTVKNLSSG